MQIEEIKRDLDAFSKELFYGFSKLVIAEPNDSKMEFYGPMIKMLGEELQKKGIGDNFLTAFHEMIDDYRDKKLDENKIRILYTTISRCRSLGIIIHNVDALTSVKMEKYHVEQENIRLAEECKHLNEELDAYKKYVALQGKTLQTGVS